MDNTSFYGKGMIVDTSQKSNVITQFIGNPLTEIKRFYVQKGKLIPNSKSNIAGVTGNSIAIAYYNAEKLLSRIRIHSRCMEAWLP